MKDNSQTKSAIRIPNSAILSRPRLRCPTGSNHDPRQLIGLLMEPLDSGNLHKPGILGYLQPKGGFICFLLHDSDLGNKLRSTPCATCGSIVGTYGSSRTDHLTPDSSSGNSFWEAFAQLQHCNRESLCSFFQIVCCHLPNSAQSQHLKANLKILSFNSQIKFRNPQSELRNIYEPRRSLPSP